MDEFIWDAAEEMNIDLKVIGYPKRFKDFRTITKQEDASVNLRLRRLFGLIKDYPELVAFSNTLKYPVSQKYHADAGLAKRSLREA